MSKDSKQPSRPNDPTAIPLLLDPTQQRMRGVAVHGNTPFDVPYISQIDGNLWTGGCAHGLVLPQHFQHLISLYPWEQYTIHHKHLATYAEFEAYDSEEGVPQRLDTIVSLALDCVAEGPTLIHCQAGLNRSGLVAGLVLVRQGHSGDEAVELLRERRSPAVLCNRTFESFVRFGGVWKAA